MIKYFSKIIERKRRELGITKNRLKVNFTVFLLVLIVLVTVCNFIN